MKSTFTLLAAMLGTAFGAFAADTTEATDTVNGLVYTITGSEATLVGPADPSEYSGSGSARTTLTIPDTVNGVQVTTIAANAFKDATGISRVVFPSELHDIGASAFQGCTGLTSLSFPEHLRQIEESAFQGCSGLTSLMTNSNLETLGQNAFADCTGMKTLVLLAPHTVSTGAFAGCNSLESVTLAVAVATLEPDSFKDCTALKDLYMVQGKSSTPTVTGAFTGVADRSVKVHASPGMNAVQQDAWKQWAQNNSVFMTDIDFQTVTGIDGVASDEASEVGATYFTITGTKVNGEPTVAGCYVKVTGNRATKIIVR